MSGEIPSTNVIPTSAVEPSSSTADEETSSQSFAAEVVSKCEGIVEDYRKGTVKSKSETIAAIYNAISHAGPATEEVARARDFSFASFVAQIDEIDASRKRVSNRTAAPNLVPSDTTDENEGQDQTGQPLDRGRATSRSPVAAHGRKHSHDSSSSTERPIRVLRGGRTRWIESAYEPRVSDGVPLNSVPQVAGGLHLQER